MEFLENKTWPAVIALSLMGLSFWWLERSWHAENSRSPEELSYVMPRPKMAGPDYDLSGRRLVYSMKELETSAKAAAEGKLDPAKTDKNGKGKAEAAKRADSNQKKTAQNSRKKNDLAIRIVDRSNGGPVFSRTADLEKNTDSAMPLVNTAQEPVPSDSGKTANEEKISASQWRSRLFANPSEALAYNFFKSYRKGDVGQHEYLQISEELLGDPGADRQDIGIYLLKLEAGPATFSVLVKHYTESAPDDLKRKLYAVMKSYGELSRFGILSRLLYSSDSRVVAMATQVLQATVEAQSPSGQGGGRPPASVSIPAASFKTFLPALRRLALSENPSIAQQAQALLQSIQTLLTA